MEKRGGLGENRRNVNFVFCLFCFLSGREMAFLKGGRVNMFPRRTDFYFLNFSRFKKEKKMRRGRFFIDLSQISFFSLWFFYFLTFYITYIYRRKLFPRTNTNPPPPPNFLFASS